MNKQDVFAKIRLESGVLVRRWGFEAEHPVIEEAKNNSSYNTKRHFEFVNDPSVDSDQADCECECRDCTFHECNCDNCEDYNDDPDHCSDCQTVNELSTSDPVLTAWNPELEEFLQNCQDIEDGKRELGSAWGDPTGQRWSGHIHIEARDLTRRQVLTALAVSDVVFRLAPEWLLGWEDTYNRTKVSDSQKAEFRAGKRFCMPRDCAVSATNVQGLDLPQPYEVGDTMWGKTTLEFRLFRTTFDPELIQIRAGLARAIVNFAKANEFGLYWIAKCQTFEEVLFELGFGHH